MSIESKNVLIKIKDGVVISLLLFTLKSFVYNWQSQVYEVMGILI